MVTTSVGARDFDVVVYGATGFVGKLTAGYLARSAPVGVRIALGGRSASRLAAVRDDLGERAADWPLVVADSGDEAAVAEMANRTKVVLTTVGPYQRYGMPVVEACARAGTHYADLTGETLFVRDSADRCHELARSTGARIVHACGFDSIPSDLGLLLAWQRAHEDAAGDLAGATLVLASVKGGLSGGTFDSKRAEQEVTRHDRRRARLLADPYALSPDRKAEPDRVFAGAWAGEGDAVGVRYESELKSWTGPFVMAPFNTRIVRRSNALQDYAYGRRLRYREVMGFGRSPVAPVMAGGVAVGLEAFGVGMGFAPARALLDRVLPAPGEGPSEKTRERGHFLTRTHVRTESGARYVASVGAHGDPGYAATSVMLGESALCLAGDGEALPDRAGVLTPASGMGLPLAERLRAAGLVLKVQPA